MANVCSLDRIKRLGFPNTQARNVWIHKHKLEIQEYLQTHSRAQTRRHFHISGVTLAKISLPASKDKLAQELGFKDDAGRRKWLLDHQGEVNKYYQANGHVATMKKYHISWGWLNKLTGHPFPKSMFHPRKSRAKGKGRCSTSSTQAQDVKLSGEEPPQMGLDAFVRLLSDLCIEYRARGVALTELRGAFGKVYAELSQAQRSAEFWQKQTEGIKAKLEELIRK